MSPIGLHYGKSNNSHPLRISAAPKSCTINKLIVYATRGITLTLPTYLLRLAPLRPALPAAYPKLGHVGSVAGHFARQISHRCDGEAIEVRRSRHRTGRGPYRGQVRPDEKLTSLLAWDVRISTGQTYIYPLVTILSLHTRYNAYCRTIFARRPNWSTLRVTRSRVSKISSSLLVAPQPAKRITSSVKTQNTVTTRSNTLNGCFQNCYPPRRSAEVPNSLALSHSRDQMQGTGSPLLRSLLS